jgi:hypothetical protein
MKNRSEVLRLLDTALVKLSEVKPRNEASNNRLREGKEKVRSARAKVAAEPEGEPAPAPAPTPEPTPTPEPAPTSIIWGARVYHASLGMANDPPWGQPEWDRWESDCGGKPVSMMAFGLPFGKFVLLPLQLCQQRSATPLLTTMTEETTISQIAAGQADAKIDAMAAVLASFGGTVLLRFAHEFNGSWYAYGYTKDSAPTYAAAFKRVASRVKAKAPKTKMVWCPNILGGTSVTDPGPYYPGDDSVEIVGVDGYSYDAALPSSRVFRPTVDRLKQIAPGKPIYICETGCRELPGKPEWIAHLLEVGLPKELPEIKGFTYFNGTEDSWPIQTSTAATAAFAKGIGSDYYR